MPLSILKYLFIIFFRGKSLAFYLTILFSTVALLFFSYLILKNDLVSLTPIFLLAFWLMIDIARFQSSDFIDISYLFNIPFSFARLFIALYCLMFEFLNIKGLVLFLAIIFILLTSDERLLIAISVIWFIAYTFVNTILLLLANRQIVFFRIYQIAPNLISLFIFFQCFRIYLDSKRNIPLQNEIIVSIGHKINSGISFSIILIIALITSLFYVLTVNYLISNMPFQRPSGSRTILSQ